MGQKYMIYTERGWKVQIREKALSVDQNGWLEQDIIVNIYIERICKYMKRKFAKRNKCKENCTRFFCQN